MKPSELTIAVEICINALQPCIIWGSPGIGKSNIMHQTAARLGLAVKDVRAVLLDPVDLRGLPCVIDGKSKWAIPDFLPTSGKGILFLDELNRAPVLVQNACFQLILDRKLGEYTLPDGWAVTAACNQSGTGTNKMSDALRNRFIHLQAEVDVTDWCKWAVAANIEPVVIAFIRFRPELLHQYDTKADAFPTPRSWEFVSKITAMNATNGIAHSLFAGAIGEAAAIEYSAFLKLYKDLPSIDAILLNPGKEKIPEQPATMYAIASALARRMNDSNISRVLTYLGRMPAEFAVMSVKDGIQRDSSLQGTPEFTKWAIENQEVFA